MGMLTLIAEASDSLNQFLQASFKSRVSEDLRDDVDVSRGGGERTGSEKRVLNTHKLCRRR